MSEQMSMWLSTVDPIWYSVNIDTAAAYEHEQEHKRVTATRAYVPIKFNLIVWVRYSASTVQYLFTYNADAPCKQ